MLYCNNCIINPICKIGCDKLSENIKNITLEDFNKYTELPRRLMSLLNISGIFNLKSYNNIEVKIDYGSRCTFLKSGKPHREDGPAIEFLHGTKEWWRNGKLHREDGPAIEFSDGSKLWYIKGKRHREDGPSIIYANRNKFWYKNGKLHREDGPAVELVDGYKSWFKNGEAIEHANGEKH